MKNQYQQVTNFIALEELDDSSKEFDVNGGITALTCAIVTLGCAIVTAIACPSGSCTSYCKI